MKEVRERRERKRAEKEKKPRISRRDRTKARAALWIGRTVGGRAVVGFKQDKNGLVRLRLHCGNCGAEATQELFKVAAGRVRVCDCQRGALVRDRSEARAREWIGREVAGRVVVGAGRNARANVVLRLHCGNCGRNAEYVISSVAGGRVKPCRCCRSARPSCAP